MEIFKADVAIVGAGGAGLRAAIAVAEADPSLTIALISKVYPMRSHTVAAEGGAAAVTQAHDSLEAHFHDTVAGGDWLCEQDVVEFFVGQAHEEMVQMEHWGCPWSRKADGRANVRAFGGMKIERTWFAADKTGFHMLHTLFQTSIKYPSIKRFDEHFCVDLVVDEGRVQGVVAIEIATGEFRLIQAKSVIIATGGAGRVFRENTNGGIVTGDGMALAYRHGVPLRDMEFVQYHPTCMPGTGLLFTEACRGEGGFLLNKDGYRYLQDYGLGPAEPTPRNKAMELGPRDRLSQAYWHEKQKGRTVDGPARRRSCTSTCATWARRSCASACRRSTSWRSSTSASIRPRQPIPVLPAVHYTMGGITADGNTAAPLPGLYSVGECSSVGIHGANRLGSNSLTELHRVRQGRRRPGGRLRARRCRTATRATLRKLAEDAAAAGAVRRRAHRRHGTHRHAAPRNGQEHGRRLRHLPHRRHHAVHLRQARRTEAALQARAGRRPFARPGTPTGCWRSSSATCSTWRRRWRIRRSNRRESRGSHQRLDGFEAARRRELPQALAGATTAAAMRRASATAR